MYDVWSVNTNRFMNITNGYFMMESYYMCLPRLKYLNGVMFAISSGMLPVILLPPMNMTTKRSIYQCFFVIYSNRYIITYLWFDNMSYLPISNVERPVRFPNSEGIGPSNLLFPGNTDTITKTQYKYKYYVFDMLDDSVCCKRKTYFE